MPFSLRFNWIEIFKKIIHDITGMNAHSWVRLLVDYFILICGYSLLSFTLASAVVNCHSTSFCLTFLSVSQCFVSTRRVSRSPILRFRHCRVNALSSISAILSQLPYFGVGWISRRFLSAAASSGGRLRRAPPGYGCLGVEVVAD